MTPRAFLLRLICLISAAGLLAAQQAPPQRPKAVTLNQAIQEALEANLNLLAERYNISVAETRLITARLRPNPVLTLDADHLLPDPNERAGSVNPPGPPEYSVRMDWVFERGGKRESRIALADAQRSVAQLGVLNTVRSTIYDVDSAFVDVQAAKEALALAQENLKSLNELVSINTVRVNAGDLSQVELLRSRVAALQFQNQVKQAELKLRAASNRLQLLIGRRVYDPDFDVTGPLRRDVFSQPVEEFRNLAFQFRPDLLSLQKDQARSQADLRLQLAQGKVDYTFGAEYRRQQGRAGKGDTAGVFFSTPLPLYNRNQGEIERARRESQQLELRVKALQATIGNEVQNAYDSYLTAKQLLETVENEMLGKAREVRSITEYSYRRGEASLVEFLDAQRAYNDTVQTYNDARAEYARNLYLIDSIIGRSVNP